MYQAALCELKMEEVSRERTDKLDQTQRKLDQFYENMDLMRQNQYIASEEEEIGGRGEKKYTFSITAQKRAMHLSLDAVFQVRFPLFNSCSIIVMTLKPNWCVTWDLTSPCGRREKIKGGWGNGRCNYECIFVFSFHAEYIFIHMYHTSKNSDLVIIWYPLPNDRK